MEPKKNQRVWPADDERGKPIPEDIYPTPIWRGIIWKIIFPRQICRIYNSTHPNERLYTKNALHCCEVRFYVQAENSM